MIVTGTAQQQAWRERVLPPVERVRPGLWSIPVPIPNSPLRYVLCYALEHQGGVVLVDPGWPAEASWDALVAGLSALDKGVEDVTGVLVTHAHQDHYGLASRVRDASGAWVAMHERDAALITYAFDDHEAVHARRAEWLRRCGADQDEIHLYGGSVAEIRRWAPPAAPDRHLDDGERLSIGRFDVEVVWTPGHSPGHLTFHERTDGLLLAGDHLLPRISPNISAFVDHDESMLDDYLASLDRVGALPVGEVLPGHEYRFSGAAERAADLKDHHEKRLAEIVAATSVHEPRSTWLIAADLTWSRGWDELTNFNRRAAVGETLAHLYCLEGRGDVVRTGDNDVWLWLRSSG